MTPASSVSFHHRGRSSEIGSGVYEIREQDGATWYRVLYVAKLSPRRVYVLHAVKKDQNKLPQKDKDLAKKRYQKAGLRLSGWCTSRIGSR
ncbi:type II toxin-antitoxin system RelE/ParE family toxin [Rhodococcus aetherivorans]|uniref:type II toxin-antitoxin system RelE/ParE family toxin n=1 Tax=Rhodococcus aetherivorans TaxID=191292 RepID=UPI003C6DD31F